MLVICGATGTGKSTLVNQLVKKHKMKKIVTYTTRPPRRSEKDGEDYYFISDKLFNEMKNNGDFADVNEFDTAYGTWRYGLAKMDCVDSDDRVVILTPSGICNLRDNHDDIKMKVFCLTADESTMLYRLLNRGDSDKESKRRVAADRIDFDGISNVADFIIPNNGDLTLKDLAKVIMILYKGSKTKKEE